jgi:hypothetical protein
MRNEYDAHKALTLSIRQRCFYAGSDVVWTKPKLSLAQRLIRWLNNP